MDAPWISETEKFGSRYSEPEEIGECRNCGYVITYDNDEACRNGKNRDNIFCCHDCFDEFYEYERVV